MLTLVAILVDGVIYSSWLFIVAVGLSLTFGVMKILNVAHGSLYAFGAYASATLIGAYFAAGWVPLGAYAAMLVAAIAVGVVLGLVLERGLLRLMYGRDEVIIVLVTYAAFLVLEDMILLVWGTNRYFAFQPYEMLGNTSVGSLSFANYDFGLVGLALVVGGLLWWGLMRTRQGKLLQAVIHDREMAQSMGINVTRVYTATFVLGAVLGALGGAVTAPQISVTPGIGVEVIVIAFAVVVVGGMGSIPGAAIGALIVGLIRAATVHLFPQVELFVIYAVMSLVLAFRPQGLFSRAAARKI
jgi:branched-chain amino acid transport system permease protein